MHSSTKALIMGAAALALVACEDSIAPSPSATSADDPVVARVDGAPIMQSDVDAYYESLPPDFRQVPQVMLQERLIERLVDRKIVAAEAEKSGLAETEDFKNRLRQQRETLLQDMYLPDRIDAAMTPERLEAAYSEIIADFTPSEEVKARHILVETEEEAESVIAQLDEGADFAGLAAEKSIGPSAERGGDLGYFGEGTMVEPFSDAAFALETGAYSSSPVQSEFGWHVIMIEDKRMSSAPPLEEVEPEIRRREMGNVYEEIVAAMRENADVEIVGAVNEEPLDAPAAQPAETEEEAGIETGAP
ncbi:MAG: peptidylprolyl isomerase [Alphaproteobacteria bacterium]